VMSFIGHVFYGTVVGYLARRWWKLASVG
jgi:hypothetical protein